jgi:hypothetical protein
MSFTSRAVYWSTLLVSICAPPGLGRATDPAAPLVLERTGSDGRGEA